MSFPYLYFTPTSTLFIPSISSWTAWNTLDINKNKKKAIIFKSKGTVCIATEKLMLSLSKIDFVSTVKTLGVILNEPRLCDFYIQNLTLKLSNIVGISDKQRHMLPSRFKLLT